MRARRRMWSFARWCKAVHDKVPVVSSGTHQITMPSPGDECEADHTHEAQRSGICVTSRVCALATLPPQHPRPVNGRKRIRMLPTCNSESKEFCVVVSLLQNCRARRVGDMYGVNRTRHV